MGALAAGGLPEAMFLIVHAHSILSSAIGVRNNAG
jgi:hypothetical protein